MSHEVSAASDHRTAAVRMVAAAEYFKATGEIPAWARAELHSWDAPDAAGAEPCSRLAAGRT